MDDRRRLNFAESETGPDMRFDFTDLRLFLNIVDAGSITHGAERMHLAIAAASTRIRNMEARWAFRCWTASDRE